MAKYNFLLLTIMRISRDYYVWAVYVYIWVRVRVRVHLCFLCIYIHGNIAFYKYWAMCVYTHRVHEPGIYVLPFTLENGGERKFDVKS